MRHSPQALVLGLFIFVHHMAALWVGAAELDPLVGRWQWSGNQIVTVHADGTVSSTLGNSAKWRAIASDKLKQYELNWNDGRFIDTIGLAAEGNAIVGSNQFKDPVSAVRIKATSGPREIVLTPPAPQYTRIYPDRQQPSPQAVGVEAVLPPGLELLPTPAIREWTDLSGKKITAEYLGVDAARVILKLQNGRLLSTDIAKLSPEDNAFLKKNPLNYIKPWKGWMRPAISKAAAKDLPGKEVAGNKFLYTTRHFRFEVDVNLGSTLMKDLARTFELTYDLLAEAPLGIQATPEGSLFNAKLFATTQAYLNAGGEKQTSGIYLVRKRVFLADLGLMGILSGPSGWRKDDDFDPATIVHELTHMLTHDVLDALPTWANEGYAEYISNIPLRNGTFTLERDKIREGMIDRLYRFRYSRAKSKGLSLRERKDYLQDSSTVLLYKLANVMGMSNVEWRTGMPPRQWEPPREPEPGKISTTTIIEARMPDVDRLPKLYLTSHLIMYYLLEVEGEKGAAKLRRVIEINRRLRNAFMQLPGVIPEPNGFKYPADMRIPKKLSPSVSNPQMLEMAGVDALLDGQSRENVAAKLEKSLEQDFNKKIKF